LGQSAEARDSDGLSRQPTLSTPVEKGYKDPVHDFGLRVATPRPTSSAVPAGMPLSAPTTQPPLILVVDRGGKDRLLTPAAGETALFAFVETRDAQAAWDMFGRLSPDLVLIDADLPAGSGIELCRQVAEDRRHPGVPVVMVTQASDQQAIDRAYDVGAFVFETKPVDWNVLTPRLRHVVRTSRILRTLRRQYTTLEHAHRVARLVGWRWDVQTKALYCTPEMRRLYRLPEDDAAIPLEDMLERVHPEDRDRVHKALLEALHTTQGYNIGYRVQLPGDEVRFVHDDAEMVFDDDGQPLELLGYVKDVSDWLGAEEKIHSLANYDPVTGLPNRTLLRDRLTHGIAQAQRSDWVLALLLIDLDRFKDLNLSFGHFAGDALLKEVGDRISQSIRINDTVARMGADEFGLILVGIKTPEKAGMVAHKILASFNQPFQVNGHDVYITASIGIAIFPTDGENAEDLMKNVDTARYRAKDAGRNNYQFFTGNLTSRTMERLLLENQLRRALDREEFQIHYQAMLDLRSGMVVGMEALLRWNHPQRGLIPPDQFISILEETGMIVSVGEWVLKAACMQNKAYQASGLRTLRTCVNLSAKQFQQGDLVGYVARVLEETQLEPHNLELELTESLLMEDTEEAIAKLQALRDLGVRLSIDDFGTGFSSLSYLSRFPIDTLKIDKSFIRHITTKTSDIAIAKSIIALARSLGLKVVVEGVENQAQLEFFRAHMCDEIQGYYYSQPMPGADFAKLLTEPLIGTNVASAAS
jgi:diguanylate cyclase (GGDEF)-like protein